ncbi:MAG TPA: hypothetical protein VGR88_05015 [Ktedonobacterales bacterium]|nr:hypothetical protein [Ktedonobacterales bacterium]
MSIETRPSPRLLRDEQTPPATTSIRSAHRGLRWALVALAAFVALTAILGAIFVVPTMPRSVLHKGVMALFPDFTIPALALGVLCGGSALLAVVALLLRPRIGALAAVVAGAFMIGFEVVEMLVVGFTPMQTPDQFPAWLQVVYLAVGGALVVLGARLWMAETGSYRLAWPRR